MLDSGNKLIIEHSISRCQKKYALSSNMSFNEIIKKNESILKQIPVANDMKTQLLGKIADKLLPYLGILFQGCTILLFDRHGFILKRYGINLMKRQIIVFSEDVLGTNGTGLVIQNGQPVKMSKNDYYLDVLKIFETISAPVYDYNSENLLGGITVSSLNELPDYFMDVLLFICNCLSGLVNQPLHYDFSDLISILSHFNTTRYAVTDDSGHLLAGNELLISELGINNYKDVLNVPLNKLISIDNINHLQQISSDQKQSNYFDNIKPQKTGKNKPVYSLSQWSNLDLYGNIYKLLDLTPLENSVQHIGVAPTSFNDSMVGESSIWKSVVHQALKAAPTDFTVLLEGETGTGKELLASYIHKSSGRSGSFVAINCSALPKELALSELFGYESGSFTGAKKNGNIGKFELADGGTIFLDEIGDMPLDIQTYLLRFLETRTITKIGAIHSKQLDVRIIAATNRLTFEEVEKGNFRKDLFYRLNSIKIQVPPLRQRDDDILLIANCFLQQTCAKLNRSPMQFDKHANNALLQYDWPGNVRELKNKIESSVVFAEDNKYIYCSDIGLPTPEQIPSLHTPLQLSEKESLINALKAFDYNISRTAEYLKVSRSTLYRKIQRYEIQL